MEKSTENLNELKIELLEVQHEVIVECEPDIGGFQEIGLEYGVSQDGPSPVTVTTDSAVEVDTRENVVVFKIDPFADDLSEEEEKEKEEKPAPKKTSPMHCCDLCDRKFPTQKQFVNHIRGHFDGKFYACENCPERFSCRKKLGSHTRTHTLENKTKAQNPVCSKCREPYFCNACNKLAARNSEPSKPKAKNTLCLKCRKILLCANCRPKKGRQSKKPLCSICNAPYFCNDCKVLTGKTYELHAQKHLDNISMCLNCSQAWVSLAALKKYKDSFQCLKCFQRFNTKELMENHICAVLKRANNLNWQLENDTELRRFSCSICKMKFMKKNHLDAHARTHSTVKPFKCLQCPSTFKAPQNLKRHMESHSDEKKFSCGICNKKYKRKHQLQVHALSHSGNKPYKCEYCFKRYKSHDALAYHRKSHKNALHCCYCNRLFKKKSLLKFHIIGHVGTS